MWEKIGPVAFGAERPYGADFYSQDSAAKMDGEIGRILDEAKKKAHDVITKERGTLDAIAKRLIETETIEREEFEKILVANGITPKAREVIESIPTAIVA